MVAVPASVLDGIAFEPALPEPLRRALGLVRYGHAAKLFVPLRTPGRAQRGDERRPSATGPGPPRAPATSRSRS